MTYPLVDPDDLGTYLNDSNINVDRAAMMIGDAMSLASPIFAPNLVPAQAAGVIRRMAGRGYVTTTSSRSAQAAAAGSAMGAVPGGLGGVILTRYDRADLEAIRDQVYSPNSGGGVFSIDVLPAGYAPLLPPWDNGSVYLNGYNGNEADEDWPT